MRVIIVTPAATVLGYFINRRRPIILPSVVINPPGSKERAPTMEEKDTTNRA